MAQAEAKPALEVYKDLYDIGEIPPLGHVPSKMHAWVVRKDRHGPPEQSMQLEVVPTWPLDSHDVLILVMAAGVNYNGVWAALGTPISPIDAHKNPFHIAGSDASGIVWAVGSKVTRWKVGDEVVVHCNQDDGDDEECNGGDPMFSPSQRIWGYETPDGSFAVQLCAVSGANAIGVISDESKRDFVMSLGAKGVINRKNFHCWGAMPKVGTPEYDAWTKEARKFGKAIWDITGKGNDVDMVFEHPGESTFPVSCLVVKRGGMVVFCAGTSGYNITFDARYVWMRQKRIQGSHFANLLQASQANRLVVERRIDPAMSEVFSWADIPRAHTKMWKNEHLPGNMAVLVNAQRTGLRTFEDVVEASGG